MSPVPFGPALASLTDQLPALVGLFDRSGSVSFGNAPLGRLAGAAGDPRGVTIDDFQGLDEAGRAALKAMVQRALASGEPTSGEVSVAGADGAPRLYAVRVDGLRGPDGAVDQAVLVGVDVTDAADLRQRLSRGAAAGGPRAEHLPQNIIRYDLSGRATYANRELGERLLIVGGSVIGRRPHEVAPVGAPGMDAYERALDRVLATGEPAAVELPALERSGRACVHAIELSAERDATGRITGALAVGRDVTEQVRAREALAQKEREFRSLAENAGDIIIRWDPRAVTLYVNPAFEALYPGQGRGFVGRRPTELARRNPGPMRALEDRVLQVAAEARADLMELRFTHPQTGRRSVHELRLVPEFDARGAVCSVLGIGRDVSEKIAHLETIESLLHVDTLTQLANRRALRDRMTGLLSSAQRRHCRVGLLLLDLDQFKAINDGLGHSAGDELLVEVARRLRTAARPEDLLARLGGDEFVVVAPDLEDTAALLALARQLHAALSTPVTVAAREVRVTLSIGIASFPDDGLTLEELLANADAAMYEAKRAGRGGTSAYTPALGESVRRRLALEQSLRAAIAGGQLELHYQARVDQRPPVRTVGAEALVRWRHPTMGLLPPDAFVPLAEESDTIVELGRWVLHEAVRAVVQWNARGEAPLHVAVNVSPRQFRTEGFAREVADTLARAHCEPAWLWIEITEGALVSDPTRLQRALDELREIGVRISIDDFGTGYSALNYLARFPIDQLKIDKSFVHSIGRSTRDDELLKAFMAIAAALRLEVVAEGVETDVQAGFLLRQGCTQAQGWLYGRPLPEDAFVQALRAPAAG